MKLQIPNSESASILRAGLALTWKTTGRKFVGKICSSILSNYDTWESLDNFELEIPSSLSKEEISVHIMATTELYQEFFILIGRVVLKFSIFGKNIPDKNKTIPTGNLKINFLSDNGYIDFKGNLICI